MFLILNLLYIFCALNLSSQQYVAKPLIENNTSTLLAKVNISEINEEFSNVVTEKKSKVKKRPGVSVYPTPSIDTTEKYFDMLGSDEHKNSSTVPRKGAGDPPPLNEMSSLVNFTHSTNFSSSNFSKIDRELIQPTEEISLGTDNVSTIIDNGNKSKNASDLMDIDLQSKNEPKNFTNNEKQTETNITSSSDPSNSNQTVTDLDKVSNGDATSHFVTISAQTNLGNTQFSSKKPSIASAQDSTKTTSAPAIIAVIVIVILVCSLIGFITYKRLFAYWNRRHYSRVDFLIDGLYEM